MEATKHKNTKKTNLGRLGKTSKTLICTNHEIRWQNTKFTKNGKKKKIELRQNHKLLTLRAILKQTGSYFDF